MLIRIGYDIAYEVSAPTPLLLMLYVHPERMRDLRAPERILTQPELDVENYTDNFGNRCAKIVAPPGLIKLRYDNVIEDSGIPEAVLPDAQQSPVQDLPLEILPFLLGSRYCEVEKMNETAWQLFGTTQPGWARVQAVCDWVHNNVTFGYEFAREDRTALEVFEERRGVCRDFMHLALTFCRCLNIPARYATGYLGDIACLPCRRRWISALTSRRISEAAGIHSTPAITSVGSGASPWPMDATPWMWLSPPPSASMC